MVRTPWSSFFAFSRLPSWSWLLLSPKSRLFHPLQPSSTISHSMQITNFTEDLKDTTLYFQIIRLPRQFYVWIGCNSSKFGHLYAAAPTCPNHAVTVAPILGGTADNPGVGIARRLVVKTGLNIMLACNIPSNCPMIEAEAEKLIIQKFNTLGYLKPRAEQFASQLG